MPPCRATELFLQLQFQRAVRSAALCGLVAAVGCAETHQRGRIAEGDAGAQAADAASVADAGPGNSAGDAARADLDADVDAGALPGPVDGGASDAGPIDAAQVQDALGADVALVDPEDARPDAAWLVPQCDAGVFANALDRLGVAADYAALRLTNATSTQVVAQTGVACATAQDAGACKEAVEIAGRSLLPPNAMCGFSFCPEVRYALTTHGDEVKVWKTDGEAKQLFGEIDSASEAFATLFCRDIWVGCDSYSTAYLVRPDGYEVRRREQIGKCPPSYQQGYVTRFIARDGTITVTAEDVVSSSTSCPVAGRRPSGLHVVHTGPARSALAAYFARLATLEAASIPAFETLERELRALHAPKELLAAVRDAIADEHDHALRTRRLALRFGAAPVEPAVDVQPLRDRFALALDNVVEGCVRETFGALLATYQAAHTRDPEVRDTFERIARDETRHAALAFELHVWLVRGLTRAQRVALALARDAALDALREEALGACDAELEQLAGMPPRLQCEVLLAQLERLQPGLADAAA